MSSPSDQDIERKLLEVVAGREGTACPSDVARALSATDWRPLMPRVREVAARLQGEHRVDVLQRGQPVHALEARGPIRLRMRTPTVAKKKPVSKTKAKTAAKREPSAKPKPRARAARPAPAAGKPQRSVADTRAAVVKMLGRYERRIQRDAKTARAWMRKRLPTAFELVYDNYNALVFGYAPSEKSTSAFMSLALYPQYVTLFFFPGTTLRDPQHLLRGEGSVVRHIPLKDGVSLTDAAVRALVDQAVAAAGPLPQEKKGVTLIKSISPKQRPRRSVGR